MSAPKYTEWILETIDSLRKRKARPDVDRICHMVERRHGVKSAEIAADLERLVDADIVIKVEYKGSTSYRNAAKWKKSHLSGTQLNSQRASYKVLAAVRGLFAEGPGGSRATAGGSEGEEAGNTRAPTQGVTPTDIENYLRRDDTNTNLTGEHLLTVLQREVEAARLLRSRTGEYVLPGGQKPASSPKKQTSPPGAPAPARFTKRKRIKKTHGPDFEQEPLVKSPSDPRCDYCLLTSECNRSGEEEDLLICKDCNAKAHPSCMRYSADLARRSRMSPWQCIDCKTCYICDDSGDAETLLFCDACDKGYHMACHEPAVNHKPLGKWVCQRCKDDTGMEIDEDIMMDTGETSPHKSPPQLINGIADRKQTKQTSGDRKSPTVATPTQPESASLPEQSASVMEAQQKKKPVAAAWAIPDVVGFIKDVGFEKEAEAFLEQEIDGPAFLLLKRSDVLTGMSIKLGPALKIYNHVMKVQTNTHPSL